MQTRSYSIHNLVGFQIKNSTGYTRQFFDTTQIQFRNFLSDNGSPYDFTVEIGPFSRQSRACAITDDTYYISDNYMYFTDKRKLSSWEVEITNIEDSPAIRIATNFVGNITAPLNFIEFFIQYCLLQKGVSIVHSSAVGKNGRCVLFPARSGGGKTTVALSFLDKGFSYLGDNYIILDKGIARNYVSPLNVFTYNRLPVVERNLTSRQRISMFLKKRLYDITGGYFKIFEKINPACLFANFIEDDLDVGLICLLEVNCALAGNELSVKNISRGHLIRKLRYNMELDLLTFSKYIYSYGYMFPNSSISKFWQLYEQLLEHNLPSDITALSIEVPLRWTGDAIDKILGLIKNGI